MDRATKMLVGMSLLGFSFLVYARWTNKGIWSKHDKEDEPVKSKSEPVSNSRYVKTFSYTRYNRDSGIEDSLVHRIDVNSTSKIIVMIDGGKYGVNDGLVDYIAFSDPELYLSRGQEGSKKEFDLADKVLANVKKKAKESGYPPEEEK